MPLAIIKVAEWLGRKIELIYENFRGKKYEIIKSLNESKIFTDAVEWSLC